MFGSWAIRPPRKIKPAPTPFAQPAPVLSTPDATLLTVTRDGDTIVLRDQGVELRRMRRWQALSLIARLAMAVRDTDGA